MPSTKFNVTSLLRHKNRLSFILSHTFAFNSLWFIWSDEWKEKKNYEKHGRLKRENEWGKKTIFVCNVRMWDYHRTSLKHSSLCFRGFIEFHFFFLARFDSVLFGLVLAERWCLICWSHWVVFNENNQDIKKINSTTFLLLYLIWCYGLLSDVIDTPQYHPYRIFTNRSRWIMYRITTKNDTT